MCNFRLNVKIFIYIYIYCKREEVKKVTDGLNEIILGLSNGGGCSRTLWTGTDIRWLG